MSKFLLIAVLALGITSCTTKVKWEYKIVSVKGKDQVTRAEFKPQDFSINDNTLNALGVDGWELVDVYQITETVHPNFGNEEYVSGIQPNVRTAAINFVFKRKK